MTPTPTEPPTVVHPAAPGLRRLANVRMALTLVSEWYYGSKCYLDHAVRLGERLLFGEDYLAARLSRYRGQKKLAFMYPGYLLGRASFERLEHLLESRVCRVFAVAGGGGPYSQDIRRSAELERRTMERVLSETDAEEIYLIGHSQGGLLARWMVQKLDAAELVRKCIFLATPHRGTWAGALGVLNRAVATTRARVLDLPPVDGESALRMLPGSSFLTELNETPLPEGPGFLNLYNVLDPLVWPARYARLPYPEATNILLRKIGHVQPLYDHQELEIILRALLSPARHGQALEREVLSGQQVLERRVMGRGAHRHREIVTSSD